MFINTTKGSLHDDITVKGTKYMMPYIVDYFNCKVKLDDEACAVFYDASSPDYMCTATENAKCEIKI